MPGPTKKPDAIRRNRPKVPDLRVAGAIEAPKPPDGLLKATQQWWSDYWASDLAKAVQADTDVQGLRRLAKAYDTWDRWCRLIDEAPFIEGSKGQMVRNPLIRDIRALEAEIRQLEDRYGGNPRARIALGLQLTQVRRTIDDLIREVNRDPDEPEIQALPDAGDDLAETEG